MTALKMAKEFPKNFHVPNKPQYDGRDNRNFFSRFIKVNGWVQWNTPQMEESKLSLNEARKLYTALMQFLFDNGLKAFIDTERTESMMDRRISFTQIFLWFDTPIESKTPWKILKKLKENFVLVEPPFEQHRFKFSLEMPEDKKTTFEMAGRFWNWARSSGVDSQLKTEYFGNSVRFFHVAVPGEKGKLISTWDGKCESWKLEPDNLKQLGEWTVEQIHTVLN